ncbi:RNase H family protein [Ktedonobacter racemifer]|uniref:RNase H family protein n=1 Tax=Ktedonobacter racemifer TaxID=363277 RepID=UPI0002EC6497|nr:RNase H family protein [Ktedonobacter racemifer]
MNTIDIGNQSLEWDSVLKASIDLDARKALPKLDARGIVAFTDGACIKNPGGPAGWSALLWAAVDSNNGIMAEKAACLECYGHIPKAPTTTNNRAEISAVLAVLSIAPPTLPLKIYSDSEYTIKVAQGVFQMKANPDLWQIYRQLLSYRKQPPTFEWVRGHAGHAQNERADELAGLGVFNGDTTAFKRWEATQTAEAKSGMSTGELAQLRRQVQTVKAFFETQAPGGGRISEQERRFIDDMAKRMQKNTFAPSEKQRNWVKVLASKYRVQ